MNIAVSYKREIALLEQTKRSIMGCFRLSQRRSRSREPPNKLLKMVAGLASCSSSREKEMATKSSSASSSMPRESSDSAPNDGISSPRMSDFLSAPSSVWPESSPSRSPQSAARASSRGTPMPLPLPLKRQQQQQPLPLPKPTPASTSPKLSRISSRPHPLPLPADHVPAPPSIGLRSFDFEHLARLCRNFSPQCQIRACVYRCSMMVDDTGSSRELDVVRMTNKPLEDDEQVEEWLAKLKLIAELEHDNLCKLIGFSIQPRGERLLVLESSGSGESLDKVLAASAKNGDWDARMKIALGAARGLAYLHSNTKVGCPSFGPSNVLVDKDCNVKLVDLDYEDWEEAAAPPSCHKANVRSYGILLLELLTGKQQMERLLPQGRDLVQWARPLVNDTAKLSSILDPRIQCPTRTAKDLANFALNCLYSDPRLRPTMREAVSLLKALATSSKSMLLGRSATFSMRGMAMSPFSNQQHYQARSAGASPARYASPLRSPFLSCSSSLTYYEDMATRQLRRAQFSR